MVSFDGRFAVSRSQQLSPEESVTICPSRIPIFSVSVITGFASLVAIQSNSSEQSSWCIELTVQPSAISHGYRASADTIYLYPTCPHLPGSPTALRAVWPQSAPCIAWHADTRECIVLRHHCRVFGRFTGIHICATWRVYTIIYRVRSPTSHVAAAPLGKRGVNHRLRI